MAASPTTAFTLTDAAYVLISDGNENCTVSLRTLGVVRLYRGAAAPVAVETPNFRTVTNESGGFAYGSMVAPNNKIYARADKGSVVVEVDAG